MQQEREEVPRTDAKKEVDVRETPLKIDDLTIAPEDAAYLDKLDQAFEQVLEGREARTDDLIDDMPDVVEAEPGEVDETVEIKEESIDASVEPVGRVGNVQSIIESPNAKDDGAAPKAELSHKKQSVIHVGTGAQTYSQEVSDAARAEGLGWMSIGNVPASRDDGRGVVGAYEAAVTRRASQTDDERANGFVICEVDTDTGHKSQQVLSHAKIKNPDLYNDPGFSVVVTARTQDRLDLLQRSGAFDDHAGKVRFELYDPAKPQLPKHTTLAFAPDVNYMPTTRLYRTPENVIDNETEDVLVEAGEIAVATERTYIKGEAPVVMPDPDDGDLPKANWPQAFDAFFTSYSDEARTRFEAPLRGRVSVGFGKDSPENTDEGWRDRDLEKFMESVPASTAIRNWQPEVTDTITALSRQAPLVYVDGVFQQGYDRVAWSQMSKREGQLWRHTTHVETITQGAETVGAHAYVPDQQGIAYNHILIDNSKDADARATAREAFDDVVTIAGEETGVRIVQNIAGRLKAEKERLSNGDQDGGTVTETLSAVDAAERMYQKYLRDRPDGAVDHELALSLGRQLYRYGHYEEALRFADRAIKAAPQMAASAHNLRAQALIMGERYEEALLAIDGGLRISPQDPKLYRTQAAIAVRQRDDGAYVDARLNEQRYATSRVEKAARRVNLGWIGISRALERQSETAAESDADEQVAVVYTERDPDTNMISSGTAMSRNTIPRSSIARTRALDTAYAAAIAVEQAYRSQGRQAQGEAVEQFGRIIDRVAWHTDPDDQSSEIIPLHELAPEHVQLIGEAAVRAAELAPVNTALERAAYRPTSASVVRERGEYAADDIAIGDEIDRARGERQGIFSVNLSLFNKPVIIEGATGSGKTTTVSNIALGLAVEGIPWLIIDAGPSPSYGNLPDQARARGQEVFYWNPMRDDIPMPTLDIMNPVRGASPQLHLESLMPWVQTVSNGGEPLPQLVGEAAYNIFSEAGYDVFTEDGDPNLNVLDNPTAPGLHAFADRVVYKAATAGYSKAAGDVTAFAERRVKEIKRMERLLGNARPIDWDWLFDHNVVLDLSDFESDEMKQAYAAGVQTMYAEYLKTRFSKFGGANIGLQHVTFVEEGHHLYGIPVSQEAAAQHQTAKMWAARTTAARKLGEGTVVITQAPNKIISEVMENADLVIAHRTPAGATRKPVADVAGIDEGSEDYEHMRALDNGQAYISQSREPLKLVQIAEPADLEREITPVEVDVRSNRPPLEAINGGRRPDGGGDPYSNDELKEAYRSARSAEHASWVVWGTQLAIAEMTGEKLGAPPQVLQRQWASMDARKRECLLDEINEVIVGERQEVLREFFSPHEFKVALKTAQVGMLKGQPLAGRRAGTKFIVPQLVGVHEYEQRTQPFGEPKPNPRGRAWPIRVPLRDVNVQQGTANQGPIRQPRTVREQLTLIERSSISTVGDDKVHAHNRKVAFVALLGANAGRTFFKALGNFARGRNEAVGLQEQYARIRHAEVAMGLVREGDPRQGPLTQYISLTGRFLKKAA